MNDVCQIEGCTKKVLARGWCGAHYYHWRTHGDPDYVAAKTPLAGRFWARVDDRSGDCWLWTGPTNLEGYGLADWSDCSTVLAHRIAYELEVGPIPAGTELDHLCHNADPDCVGSSDCLHRRCVRPDHLEAVTHAENARRRGLRPKCKRGHFYTPENTRRRANGSRVCRACVRERASA